MKKGQYSEVKIISILKEYEAGKNVNDICREYGMSSNTLYRWKSKYAGMTVNDVKRLKQLEKENGDLKQIVADLTLDNRALKAINSKNF
jgi:putative transposase